MTTGISKAAAALNRSGKTISGVFYADHCEACLQLLDRDDRYFWLIPLVTLCKPCLRQPTISRERVRNNGVDLLARFQHQARHFQRE